MAAWLSSTGISPSRGSRATLPIACDASPPELRLHARAVSCSRWQSHLLESSLSCLCVVARKQPNLLHVLVFLARSLGRSWRTVRMARHKQIVSVCPMPAGNYPPGVLVKELRQPARKGGLTGCLLRFNSGQSPGWR